MLQTRIWELVEARRSDDMAAKAVDLVIISLIALSAISVIAGSVPHVQDRYGPMMRSFEMVAVAIFSLEYILRLWACGSQKEFSGIRGRLRFALHPMALIDLAAIVPFYLPFVGVDLRIVRVFRLARILRIIRIGRYDASLSLIRRVVQTKKEELLMTSAIMAMLLIVCSSFLYYAESAAQPDAFGSIPAAMWWAVATLTTVGYGDVTPVTVVGRVFAAGSAIVGIGMFALPTGVLGAGFVEEIQNKKKPKRCPHCQAKLG